MKEYDFVVEEKNKMTCKISQNKLGRNQKLICEQLLFDVTMPDTCKLMHERTIF
jgi:hypothetical protein